MASAESLADPGVDDADTIGDELDLSGPRLKINVMLAQIVDLLLRALDEDESTQLHALRLEDRGIESLDPPVAREAVEKYLVVVSFKRSRACVSRPRAGIPH